MTDEQIKQKAEEYAQHKWFYFDGTLSSGNIILTWKEGFEDGAHSRDEEIEELKDELESLRKGFYERGNKLKELMLANNKLRNPWISVKERLPEYKTKVLVRYIDGDIEVVWYRNNKFVCVVADQQRCIGKTKELVEGLLVEKPIYSTPKREVVTDIVTHWLPIPQIKKGE